ncbi:hypothetical protein UPYG_G00168590 [Umbra pygmaea]|uniref:Uncharacterized protein n=1 Tax=Umbra pygmaea TaxID=75934 RepID=A0ABD0WN44_UMBPY
MGQWIVRTGGRYISVDAKTKSWILQNCGKEEEKHEWRKPSLVPPTDKHNYAHSLWLVLSLAVPAERTRRPMPTGT